MSITGQGELSALVRADVEVRGPDSSVRRADIVAGEIPVAMSYNGISHAVMMASPTDLEDLALGFSLTEGIIRHPDELYDVELVAQDDGITVEMRISAERFAGLKLQRRNMTGRTGCGLCGTESLAQAIRPVTKVPPREPISDEAIQHAVNTLREHQPLQAQTGATHAAAWCDESGTIIATREDVGRHNALDKLIGFQLGRRRDSDGRFERGFALISSRASFEMVQKSATVGIGCLVAVSAPTALAISEARKANMMLVGFARPNRHVIYTTGTRPADIPFAEENVV